MVEGARLESVYTGNGIEGSNPSLSAQKTSITCDFRGFFSNFQKLWHQTVAPVTPYREPELRHYNYNLSRRWFIIFYAFDHQKQALVRKRLFHPINKFKTKHERLQVATIMMDTIRRDLRAGKILRDDLTSMGTVTSFGSMSVLKAIEHVREQKDATNHRKNYTKGFTMLASNWKSYLYHKNNVKRPPADEQEEQKLLAKIDLSLKALTQPQVFDFFSYLNGVKKISNKTYNNYKGYLSTVIKFLMKRDPRLFKANPVELIDKLPVVAKKHAAFNAKQIEAIRAKCIELNQSQLLLFIQFIYYTLARPNEIMKIRIRDIQVAEKRIFIPGENSKTKFDEYVAIPQRLATIIQESGILNHPEDHYVFGNTGSPGKQYYKTTNSIWKKNRVILDALELLKINDNYSLYSYKHSGAISLYQSTKDIALVQRQCRHRELSETSKYLRDLGLIDGMDGMQAWEGGL